MTKPKLLRPPRPHERDWGEGTVKEVRPGVWRAWRARVRKPDGTSSRPSKTFTGGQAEERAKLWARGDVEPDVMLLGLWLDRWLALRLPLIRPQTARRYRGIILSCADLAARPIAEITTDDWQALTNAMLGRYSWLSVRAWRSIIASALKAAVPRYLPYNPLTGVKLPKQVEKPIKSWRADEVDRLVAAVDGYKHEAWLLVSIGTGIRLGESRALLWADVDLKNRTIEVSKSLDRHTDELGPTKSGRIRTVDIPDELVPVLRKLRARQRPSEQRVFGSRRDGRPLGATALNSWLVNACKRANVREMGPHSARHTFATLALEAGVPLKEVSEALGHSNVAITAQTYSHVVEQRRRRAADAIGAALTRGRRGANGTQDGTRRQA